MKIAVAFGTRPEIIKLSPVIRALEKASEKQKSQRVGFFIIHSNQHYDKDMDSVFLKELKLPKPKYNLNIGSALHGEMTGKMIIEAEKILINEKPDLLIVQGDTNTVLALAIAASKLHIKIAHVEAGLRSYTDIPEETNRIITDKLSDFLFAPTLKQKNILINEGINKKKIFVVGNTVVDAVFQNLKIAKKSKNYPIKLKPKKYFLITAHRQENVDDPKKLKSIFKALSEIQNKHKLEAVFPLHPRTKKRLNEYKMVIPKNIKITSPAGYLEMLYLIKNARLIVTDSGGIQEEACTLCVPCVTMRESTERPETVEIGGNIVVGTDTNKIVKASSLMIKKKILWKNPFGKGDTGEKIIKILLQ
ncbi:UDP-N-acetylglucosamine 2-epimerase (non-hydrolyzing) [Candidatus Peregrinibacteria bacterium]|nr:UDP-N-acetylglucosamine 2-epimerase (non-hydrolyzing) [Candidatus Peregrinibacteria bacterium]